jgi:hypothetical protein
MSPYTAVFNEAFAAYQAQAQRPGFSTGYFTLFRHSCTLYPAIAQLKIALEKSDSIENAQNIIFDHLSNQQHKNNTHSFNSYLIDALQKNDDHCDWSYFEKNKVKTYHGTLYRGMSRGPEIIFKEGLSCKDTSCLLNSYRKRTNYSVGISTSKSYDTALDYALKRLMDDNTKPIHVYKINYRGGTGVDVKYSNPQNFFLDKLHQVDWKDEVNIMTSICPEDIVGVYVLKKNGKALCREWIDNPAYLPERETEVLPDVSLRKHVFCPK